MKRIKKWQIIFGVFYFILSMYSVSINAEEINTKVEGEDMTVNSYMEKSRILNVQVSQKRKDENYEYNKTQNYKPTGLLDSQKGKIAEYKLGSEKVKNVGCGAVGIYNALYLKGNPKCFENVLYKCEDITMLKGKFGCNSYRLGEVLEYFGYKADEDFKFAFKYEDIDSIKDYGKIFVAAFWNKESVFGGAHIIALEIKDDGAVRAYNSGKPNYASFEEFKKDKLTENKFIALYVLR